MFLDVGCWVVRGPSLIFALIKSKVTLLYIYIGQQERTFILLRKKLQKFACCFFEKDFSARLGS
jgi:hypothetical protein